MPRGSGIGAEIAMNGDLFSRPTAPASCRAPSLSDEARHNIRPTSCHASHMGELDHHYAIHRSWHIAFPAPCGQRGNHRHSGQALSLWRQNIRQPDYLPIPEIPHRVAAPSKESILTPLRLRLHRPSCRSPAFTSGPPYTRAPIPLRGVTLGSPHGYVPRDFSSIPWVIATAGQTIDPPRISNRGGRGHFRQLCCLDRDRSSQAATQPFPDQYARGGIRPHTNRHERAGQVG